YADMVVGAVRALGDHDVGGHAREVCLICESDQIEHETYLIVETVELADRYVRQLYAGKIALLRKLDAPLDFPHGVEVFAENRTVACADATLERTRAIGNEIENAFCLLRDGLAFFGRVAFAEQLHEDLARVEFHGQRRSRV